MPRMGEAFSLSREGRIVESDDEREKVENGPDYRDSDHRASEKASNCRDHEREPIIEKRTIIEDMIETELIRTMVVVRSVFIAGCSERMMGWL